MTIQVSDHNAEKTVRALLFPGRLNMGVRTKEGKYVIVRGENAEAAEDYIHCSDGTAIAYDDIDTIFI